MMNDNNLMIDMIKHKKKQQRTRKNTATQQITKLRFFKIL
jgi:hypothetical protein